MLGLDLNNLVMVRALVLFPPWLSALLLLQRVVRMLAFEMGGLSGYLIYTGNPLQIRLFILVNLNPLMMR